MPVAPQLSSDGQTLTIAVQGPFNYHLQTEFQQAYQDCTASPARVCVDLSAVTTLDSAALSMLMLLRDDMGSEAAPVALLNPPEAIRMLLEVSLFENFFDVR